MSLQMGKSFPFQPGSSGLVAIWFELKFQLSPFSKLCLLCRQDNSELEVIPQSNFKALLQQHRYLIFEDDEAKQTEVYEKVEDKQVGLKGLVHPSDLHSDSPCSVFRQIHPSAIKTKQIYITALKQSEQMKWLLLFYQLGNYRTHLCFVLLLNLSRKQPPFSLKNQIN